MTHIVHTENPMVLLRELLTTLGLDPTLDSDAYGSTLTVMRPGGGDQPLVIIKGRGLLDLPQTAARFHGWMAHGYTSETTYLTHEDTGRAVYCATRSRPVQRIDADEMERRVWEDTMKCAVAVCGALGVGMPRG